MSDELEQNKLVELDACRVCGTVLPKISMSKVDDTICARCASKLIARAQLDDGSWYDDGLSLGIMPWEQFPTEPRSAFITFSKYIGAYPKELSVKELSTLSGYGVAAIRHWIKRWKWKERFFEWSRKCDKDLIMQQHDIRKEMNDRQVTTAKDLMKKAMERIARIDMDELDPKVVLQWAEVAAKMERTAVEDNRKIAEVLVEGRQYSAGTEKKAEGSTGDKSLQEVLNILASAGAINIETRVTTPKVVDQEPEEFVDTDYQDDEEVQE